MKSEGERTGKGREEKKKSRRGEDTSWSLSSLLVVSARDLTDTQLDK